MIAVAVWPERRGLFMKKRSLRASLLLLLTALIWGVAFVAQDVAADTLGPFTFNGARMLLAAVALLPVAWFSDRRAQKNGTADWQGTGSGVPFRRMQPAQRKTLLICGAACGVMLTLGSVFQQAGITLGTGAGKAGFITALYIVLVPLCGLFLGKRPGKAIWLAVVLSLGGLYLLCISSSLSIDPGDGLLMLSALAFTGDILVVDYFSTRTDCVKMSCLQFFTGAVLCILMALLLEKPTWTALSQSLIPVLYAGLLSCAVGYTLQIIGQRDADPTVASLIMSLESVFAVLAGWLILGDALSLREFLGCALMMGGIVIAQLL